MQFDLTSIQPTDPLKEFLSAVLRIDRAHINTHMQQLSTFDIEITVNGRTMMPDVLIKTLLAAKDQEIARLQHLVDSAPRSAEQTPAVDVAVQSAVVTQQQVTPEPTPTAQVLPVINDTDDVTTTADLVIFKKRVFRSFYEDTQRGIDNMASLLEPRLRSSTSRNDSSPRDVLNRLLIIENSFQSAFKIISRVRHDI